MPNFIMICGPQAVGKMTVGQELTQLMRINNTNISAEEVAKMIKNEFKL